MPSLIFSHAEIERSLVVETGANEISWSYTLNTQSYPTYGGEVVQVLSTSIEDISIQGEVASYAKMEEIYRWFLEYMAKATQGYGDKEGYSESPVVMQYPHRGWTFSIKPKTLPNMKYGRDIVVPQWMMMAHVVVPDPETQQLSIDHGLGSLVGGDLANFSKRVSADIGFRSQNPFSDPLGVLTKDEFQLYYDGDKSKLPEGVRVEGEKVAEVGSQNQKYVGKQMSSMFEKLMNGGVESIFGNLGDWLGGEASKPAEPRTGQTDEVENPGG